MIKVGHFDLRSRRSSAKEVCWHDVTHDNIGLNFQDPILLRHRSHCTANAVDLKVISKKRRTFYRRLAGEQKTDERAGRQNIEQK